jgi:putative transposase
MTEYADAKRTLERLHRELMELNPSAARSLEEGMEETLTVHRLRVPSQLRRTLASTNVIESAFSIVETVCRNVKRWRAGDHIERWVGSGLLVAERQFRKVQGYRDIPALVLLSPVVCVGPVILPVTVRAPGIVTVEVLGTSMPVAVMTSPMFR